MMSGAQDGNNDEDSGSKVPGGCGSPKAGLADGQLAAPLPGPSGGGWCLLEVVCLPSKVLAVIMATMPYHPA